jgi:hypothetical protein
MADQRNPFPQKFGVRVGSAQEESSFDRLFERIQAKQRHVPLPELGPELARSGFSLEEQIACWSSIPTERFPAESTVLRALENVLPEGVTESSPGELEHATAHLTGILLAASGRVSEIQRTPGDAELRRAFFHRWAVLAVRRVAEREIACYPGAPETPAVPAEEKERIMEKVYEHSGYDDCPLEERQRPELRDVRRGVGSRVEELMALLTDPPLAELLRADPGEFALDCHEAFASWLVAQRTGEMASYEAVERKLLSMLERLRKRAANAA